MKLPEGVSEARFLEALASVIKLLSTKFRFGYHDSDDIKQKGAQFAIEAMASDKYNAALPLENFLYTHIRNRLINFKRDNYVRPDPPCKTCVFFQNKKCSVFDSRTECGKYENWQRRNDAKKNLMKPVSDDSVTESAGLSETADAIDLKELEEIIDGALPLELRADYLRLRAGASIPAIRREKVRIAILEIKGIRGFLEGEAL